MNTDARRQIEEAARYLAATVKHDVTVYRLPSGAFESRSSAAAAPDGGEPVYTASYSEVDLLRSAR